MADDETPDTPDTTPDETPDETPGPQPRPRSATSRARRIGGAAAAPRPAPAPPASSEPESGPDGHPSEPESGPDDHPSEPDDETTETARKTERAGVKLSVPAWTVWTPAIAFAAAAVVFLVLFLVARVGGDDPDRSPQTREQVLAAAKTCLATLNTYRYDKLPAAEAAGIKCTTGQLTADYKRTVTNIIEKNAPSLQAIQQAKITTAGIESVTGNGKQWTVLAYGSLSITTKQQKQGRNDPFAVVARLQQVGNSWLLSKIDTVSSFSS